MRPATPRDYAEITRLLDAAFAPSRYESQLVCRLRAHGKTTYEWVSTDGCGLSGHICYSRAFRDPKVIGLHLAPVAVRPDVQGHGIGRRLISQSLKALESKGAAVFVLGDPNYYRQFGFVHVDSPICPFDRENEHFMAFRWSEGDSFVVGYEEEFQQA